MAAGQGTEPLVCCAPLANILETNVNLHKRVTPGKQMKCAATKLIETQHS